MLPDASRAGTRGRSWCGRWNGLTVGGERYRGGQSKTSGFPRNSYQQQACGLGGWRRLGAIAVEREKRAGCAAGETWNEIMGDQYLGDPPAAGDSREFDRVGWEESRPARICADTTRHRLEGWGRRCRQQDGGEASALIAGRSGSINEARTIFYASSSSTVVGGRWYRRVNRLFSRAPLERSSPMESQMPIAGLMQC